MSKRTLYERLGGYDAISAVANDLFAYKRIRNWLASGSIEERMASSGKSSS
jgi:hypothetical protein